MGAARRAAHAELEVRLLGPLEVTRGSAPVALGGPKPRALLAALALDVGRVVSVDRLVENLWPATAPGTALHAIQVYVSQLRKTLELAIPARPPGYVLDLEPEQIDIRRFARLAEEGRIALQAESPEAAEGALRSALALWRGPALADFLYEPFAQAEIARLEELRLMTLEERIEADLALGRHVELVSELEAMVQSEPLRERPRRQLMLALYRSGRQADALAAYRAAREVLVEELGIEPGPELKQLEAAILRQDESLAVPETVAAKPTMQFRRLVTILFVDVVESMALAERLDPEALGRVLHRYFETVSGVLSQHGGTVEKFAGDAVMAAFGVPVSHEDDALRAARAGVEIRAAIAALNDQLMHENGVALEIRIGLESGEVVVSPTPSRQRLVAGEAVGIAARLEQSARANEIVVGVLAGRLIDHAAVLEPLGELEIKGKREPVHAYRLLEITETAPAFQRRLDAPLVGRKRELARLRKALKQVGEDGAARVVVVVGPPGIGKSRLAAELTRRAKGATPLWGRCRSYGDGITYWPLREVVRQVEPSEERDAVLAALDAETPPPAPEIAWLFRQLCEELARERPLVLVFDDVHWAEPTFLELVEQVVDRAVGAILVVCVAREELFEEQPEFLEGRENAERIVIEGLSAEETDALLDGFGGAILESDQRTRIVEAAEGNPFFLEQLIAAAAEGGLGERALPDTVQALLAARLDRLGPGERGVLERGAVIGKEFEAEDVVALLDPAGAPTVPAHLGALVERGFLRPAGADMFRFRHVLVQEAVYRAAPKRLRAELHERFSDRLDRTSTDLPELDELTGYHLEQAYRLRTQLAEVDRRTSRLAEHGGRRLGTAGVRAAKRGDIPATVNLLSRSTSLLPKDEPLRREFQCELAIGLRATGDSAAAHRTLRAVIDETRAAGDRRLEFRARIEDAFVQSKAFGTLPDLARKGIPIFEAADDQRSLGRTFLLLGAFEGARLGHHKARENAAERALTHYERSGWPPSSCLGEIATALYQGPTPVAEAIRRLEELREDPASDRVAKAHLGVMLAGLVAQTGSFDEARELASDAQATYGDLGQTAARAIYAGNILGEVERLAGDLALAKDVFTDLCRDLEAIGAHSVLAGAAGELAAILYALGQFGESEAWTSTSEQHTAGDDLDARVHWMPVKAKLIGRRGEFDRAEDLGREAVRLSGSTDALNLRARVHQDLGDVLQLAGRSSEAAAQFRVALELYELKGNVVDAARVRGLQDEIVLV